MSTKSQARSGQRVVRCKCGEIIKHVSVVYAFGTDSYESRNSISKCKKCDKYVIERNNDKPFVGKTKIQKTHGKYW